MKTNILVNMKTTYVENGSRSILCVVAIMCLLLTIGVGNVWGATVSFDLTTTTQITTQTQNSVVFTNGSATITITKSNSGTRVDNYMPGGNTEATHTRTYNTNPITFNAGSGNTISSIYITVTSSSGAITNLTGGSWSATTTVTGSGNTRTVTLSAAAQSISVTPTGTSRVTAVTITYSAAASKTLSSIAITTQPTKRAYLVGETFSKTGAVVTATYSDKTTANVSTSVTWTPTTGLVSGSNTITASYTEGGVTKTATTTVTGYTVTIQVKDVDNNTISGAGAPTASPSGASISASASGNNYVFKRWVAVTAAGTSFADANNRSTTLSGTPTGNVTIKAEYYKPINITWNANGSAYTPGTPGTAQVGYGALMSSLTVPSPAPSTASFCGDKFVGWTTEANVSQDDDTGLNLFTSVAGNSTAITEDMDFYAVFADYDE